MDVVIEIYDSIAAFYFPIFRLLRKGTCAMKNLMINTETCLFTRITSSCLSIRMKQSQRYAYQHYFVIKRSYGSLIFVYVFRKWTIFYCGLVEKKYVFHFLVMFVWGRGGWWINHLPTEHCTFVGKTYTKIRNPFVCADMLNWSYFLILWSPPVQQARWAHMHRFQSVWTLPKIRLNNNSYLGKY